MEEVWPFAIGGAVLVGLIILVAVGLQVLIVIWAYKVGKRKGQELVGLLLGIFLGWIGLIIVYVLPDESKPQPPQGVVQVIKCPNCAKMAPAEGRFCPYCGKLLNE
jgi:hypothetical protein